MAVHPTAIVERGAELGRDVEIGPYAVIGPQVRLGDRVRVGPHVVIEGRTTIGPDGEILPFSMLGGPPGHVRDRGEDTELVIGSRVSIREFVSIHRGTKQGTGRTVVGDECSFLAGSHVGHDCVIGRGVVLVTGAALGGHVEVGDFANVGGHVGVHQGVRIGTLVMAGAGSIVGQDLPPYCLSGGERARLVGLNEIGLERKGVPAETVQALRAVYRMLIRSGMRREEALKEARADHGSSPEVARFLDFIATSKRGIARHGRGAS